jgi:hypothetical protein
VKLSEAGIEGFSYDDFTKENGGDLRFADENGNMLAHEIDTWDEDGVSTVWVKVPTLNSSTTITAYYGWVFAPTVNPKDVFVLLASLSLHGLLFETRGPRFKRRCDNFAPLKC